MSVTTASAEDAAKAAQAASRTLAVLPAAARRHALTAIHDGLAAARDEALAANDRDLSAAAEAVAAGSLSQSLASRLDLRRKDKWEDMLQGILDVRDLDDPSKRERHVDLLADYCLATSYTLVLSYYCITVTPLSHLS